VVDDALLDGEAAGLAHYARHVEDTGDDLSDVGIVEWSTGLFENFVGGVEEGHGIAPFTGANV
jgi:hypothetical protein